MPSYPICPHSPSALIANMAMPCPRSPHRILELQSLLGSDQAVMQVVQREAQEVADKHGNPRRTQIVSEQVGEDLAMRSDYCADYEGDTWLHW